MLPRRKTEVDASAKRSNAAESNEVRLLSLIVGGDRRAFETLYRGYFPRLTRFLGQMTRSANIIEEIVNDTMLVVWQKAHTFNGSCKVSTWIFAIAYRKALKAMQGLDEPVESDFEQASGDMAHEPEHEIGHQQLQGKVGVALDALSFEQRTVVILTFFHGMAYEEIAETMACPVNTVKTRMFYARSRLKTLLADQMGEVR